MRVHLGLPPLPQGLTIGNKYAFSTYHYIYLSPSHHIIEFNGNSPGTVSLEELRKYVSQTANVCGLAAIDETLSQSEEQVEGNTLTHFAVRCQQSQPAE